MELKGFIVFYLNLNHDNTMTMENYIDLAKSHNTQLFAKLAEEGYPTLFVPCFDEACRVEKIDLVTPILKEEGEE